MLEPVCLQSLLLPAAEIQTAVYTVCCTLSQMFRGNGSWHFLSASSKTHDHYPVMTPKRDGASWHSGTRRSYTLTLLGCLSTDRRMFQKLFWCHWGDVTISAVLFKALAVRCKLSPMDQEQVWESCNDWVRHAGFKTPVFQYNWNLCQKRGEIVSIQSLFKVVVGLRWSQIYS